MQHMRGVVSNELGSLPLGRTESGRSWAMNALNPSDTTPISGIPDGSFGDVVLVTYRVTADVYPSTTPTTNWNVDVLGWTDPVNMVVARCVEPGVITTLVSTMNPAIGGATFSARSQQFWTDVEWYRLVSGYMTVDLDATATTNSGHMVASQYAWTPTLRGTDLAGAVYATTTLSEVWFDQPRTYAQISEMHSAFKGDAKDGAYLPYKLVSPFAWKSCNDYRLHFNCGDCSAAATTLNANLNYPAAGASVADLPFGLESTENAGANNIYVLPQASPNVVHLSVANLNPAAHLRVTCVKTYQLRVKPGTVYVPLSTPTAVYDADSITAYCAVVAKLCDGYPASFNVNGKLWPIIRSVGKTVLSGLFPALTGVYDPVMDQVEKGVAVVKKKIAEKKRIKAQVTAAMKKAPLVKNNSKKK